MRVSSQVAVFFVVMACWLYLASPSSTTMSTTTTQSLFVRGEEVLFVNHSVTPATMMGTSPSACAPSMFHFPIHVGLSLAPSSSSSFSTAAYSSLSSSGSSSKNKKKHNVRRRTTTTAAGVDTEEETEAMTHPLARRLSAIYSTTTTTSTTAAPGLFVGLLTSRDLLLSPTTTANKDSSSSSSSAVNLFTEIAFQAQQRQETVCMSYGKRYLFYNPIRSTATTASTVAATSTGSSSSASWNMLICHRFILTEGEFVVIEIVNNKRTSAPGTSSSSSSVGIHCQRVNPSDALRSSSSSSGTTTSTTTLEKEVKEFLQGVHSSYQKLHPSSSSMTTSSTSGSKAVITIDPEVPNQPSSYPTIKPTRCTDSPTSRPTSIPTLDMTAAPTFNVTEPIGDGGNATAAAQAAFYETSTFITSVSAAGSAGVATAAGVAYYVLKNAKNFIKVPMAPDDLAMQI